MTTPTLQDVLRRAIDNQIQDIHTCLPGVIEKYDHKKQKASVKPLLKKKYRDGLIESLPVIVNVPVIWPRSSNASLTFPIKKGDTVILLFAERALERYLAQGGEQEPGDPRKFDLTDAIAVPGLFPFTEDSRSENNEDVLLIYNDTLLRIRDKGNFEMETSANQIIKVAKDSSIAIEGNSKIAIKGNSEVSIAGNSKIVIEGTSDIGITGDSKINVKGNSNLTVGGNITINVTGDANVTAGGTLNLTAPTTNVQGDLNVSGQVTLGGGGPGVARIGDEVEVTVNISGGSSAGSYTGTGTITSGSGNTSSS